MLSKEVTVVCSKIYPKKPDFYVFAKMHEFQASVWIEKNGIKLSKENSLLDFLKLHIKDGSRVNIITDGCDEESAMNAMTKLFTEDYYLDIF